MHWGWHWICTRCMTRSDEHCLNFSGIKLQLVVCHPWFYLTHTFLLSVNNTLNKVYMTIWVVCHQQKHGGQQNDGKNSHWVASCTKWTEHRALGYTMLNKQRCRPEATNNNNLLSACQVGPKPWQYTPSKRNFNSSQRSRILWSMISNAVDKSKSIRIETSPLSIVSAMSKIFWMKMVRLCHLKVLKRNIELTQIISPDIILCGWLGLKH